MQPKQAIDLKDHPALQQAVSAVAEAVRVVFGQEAQQISVPGGTERASLRVQLSDRSVIATRRPAGRAQRMETRLLQTLAGQGAPVPDYLGHHDGVMFQSDLGKFRLSEAMLRSNAEQRQLLTARTFESMWRIKVAARVSGLTDGLRPAGTKDDWLTKFVNFPQKAAWLFPEIPRPKLDKNALRDSLRVTPDTFVNWDARLGNAVVSASAQVSWFDWEFYGQRGGVEDFAFLLADEFFPLPPRLSLPIFRAACPKEYLPLEPLMIRFAALRATRRVMLIRQRWETQGAEPLADLLRTDQAGYTPETVKNLCKHGAMYAGRDKLVKPLVPFFEMAGDVRNWS